MRLFKREGSPFWWYEFTTNGERTRESTKRIFADKDAAYQVMATEYTKAMDRQQFGRKPDITLSDAFSRHKKPMQGSTLGLYNCFHSKWCGEAKFEKRKLWHLDGSMHLADIRQYHLDEHRLERQADGLKPNSINLEGSVLRAVLNASKGTYNVPVGLEFKKLKGFTKSRYLSDQEELAVSDALSVPDPEYQDAKDFYTFLLDTGARFSEAMNARWADLDLTNGNFEIFRIKTQTLSMVPLSPRTITMLKRRGNKKTPFEDMGRPVQVLRRVLHEVCDQDPRLIQQRGSATPHSLRDTYASRRMRDGMTLHELSKLLGHTTIAMSAKYGHLESADVVAKVKRLAGW